MQVWAAVAVVVVGVVVLACSGPAASDATEAPGVQDAAASPSEGEALLQERCAKHHDLARVEHASKTREEWQQTVTRMVNKGATVSTDEQAVVVDYLAETYGP